MADNNNYVYLAVFVKDGKVKEQHHLKTSDQVEVFKAIAHSKGCDIDVFSLVLPESKVAEKEIAPKCNETNKIQKKGWERPVLCVETGQVFPTIRDCSEKTGIPYMTISNCIRRKNATRGVHFAFTDEEFTPRISRKKKQPKRSVKKYIFLCVDTNEQFDSAKECYEKYNIPSNTFYYAIRNKKPVRGLMFEKVPYNKCI